MATIWFIHCRCSEQLIYNAEFFPKEDMTRRETKDLVYLVQIIQVKYWTIYIYLDKSYIDFCLIHIHTQITDRAAYHFVYLFLSILYGLYAVFIY